MSVKTIREKLGTTLATISGLTVYDANAEAIEKYPAVFIDFDRIEYHKTAGGDRILHFLVTVLVARKATAAEAEDDLDPYIDSTGTSSIPAKLEALTSTDFSGAASYAQINQASPGSIRGKDGAIYLGCTFDVEVYGT